MDGKRFDELARALARSRTRRGFVATLAGGAAAVLGRGTAWAAPNSCAVGCAGLPGPQKAACKQACRQCGGDINSVCIGFGPVGPSSFICCEAGTACSFDTGTCEEVMTCPSGEPAESCSLGVTSDCAGGVCAQVVNVDGGCACVERACSFEPCTTGSDCASGLCVDIPGCCGEPNPFCGTPCGAGAGERAAGWQ
jgi:hypothetical protein